MREKKKKRKIGKRKGRNNLKWKENILGNMVLCFSDEYYFYVFALTCVLLHAIRIEDGEIDVLFLPRHIG